MLSIVVALTALVPLGMGILRVPGADPDGAERLWSMALSLVALVMVMSGLTAAGLVWFHARAAEFDLWIATAAGLLGMVFTFAITLTADASPPAPVVIIAGMIIGGGLSALAALSAALLTRRLARRRVEALTA